MDIEMISLNQLQTNPNQLLSECCDSGRPIVVELPDHRLVAIQSLEPSDPDDSLIDNLLQTSAEFRTQLLKSQVSPRKPFCGEQKPC